jgi:DNA polymerase III delta prime subunit
MIEQFIWAEKYRPTKIDDVILPERIKSVFRGYAAKGEIANLLLTGGTGVGKTTIARATLDEMGRNYIFKNGSLDSNIEVLRTDITNFATSRSFKGGRKYVIFDEFDYSNRNSVQPALRGFIEQYAANCGFILTCNYPSRIMKELRDTRFEVIDFTIRKEEKNDMAARMFKRMCQILDLEGIPYEKAAVAALVKKFRPDFRKIIGVLQGYANKNGKIDAGVLAVVNNEDIDELFGIIKAKDFDSLRKWVAEHIDEEAHNLFRAVFDRMQKHLKPSTIPYIVTVIGDYQYKAALVVDQEINMLACLVTIMAEAEFED